MTIHYSSGKIRLPYMHIACHVDQVESVIFLRISGEIGTIFVAEHRPLFSGRLDSNTSNPTNAPGWNDIFRAGLSKESSSGPAKNNA
jgi:hypothetical protein